VQSAVLKFVISIKSMDVINNSLSSSSSEDEEFLFVRRTKVYRQRKNYFEHYDDLDFFDRFRITKATVMALLNLLISSSNNNSSSFL
jgi:hypothetical protein